VENGTLLPIAEASVTVALLSWLGNADVTQYGNAFDVTFENIVFKNKTNQPTLAFERTRSQHLLLAASHTLLYYCIIP